MDFERDGEDFDFGAELPEDDDEMEREEYDANNDVTFGEEVSALGNPDLGNYADQTAGMLFENVWDTPGRSTDAPDASNVPLPSFSFEDSFSKDNHWKSSGNGYFDLWGSSGDNSKDGFFSFSKNPLMLDTNSYSSLAMNASPGLPPSTASQMHPQPSPPQPSLSPFRSFPIESVEVDSKVPLALSAAELERRLIEESRRQKAAEVDSSIHPALAAMFQAHDGQIHRSPRMESPSPATPQPHPNPSAAPSAAFPPFPPRPPFGPLPPNVPPWVAAIPPPYHRFIPVWLDLIMGRIKMLPPAVPPPHPVMHQLAKIIHSRPPFGASSPGIPHGLPPPPPSFPGPLPPPPHHHPVMPRPPMPPPFPGYNHQLYGSQSSLRNENEGWSRRPMHRKPPGMPSGKTIEDFAFDPYAGFMSKKEREWLIRIQILQCLGSGNPFVEDYYYTMWKQRQLEKGEAESALTSERNGCSLSDKKKKDKDLQPRNYKSPQFNGSLGKPTQSTTANPRHLIDVMGHADSVEDENGQGKKKMASQKKYRTLLLSLENAAVLLLRCEEKRRTAQQIQPGGASSSQLEEEAKEMMERFFSDFATPIQLSRFVQVPKGRRLLCVWLRSCLNMAEQARLFLSLLDASSRFAAIKNGGGMMEEVLPALVQSVFTWTRELLIETSQKIDMAVMKKELQDLNATARDLLLCLLSGCGRARAHSASPFFSFLSSPANTEWSSFSPASSHWAAFSGLSQSEVSQLADWLRLLGHGDSHNAARLAQSLLLPYSAL